MSICLSTIYTDTILCKCRRPGTRPALLALLIVANCDCNYRLSLLLHKLRRLIWTTLCTIIDRFTYMCRRSWEYSCDISLIFVREYVALQGWRWVVWLTLHVSWLPLPVAATEYRLTTAIDYSIKNPDWLFLFNFWCMPSAAQPNSDQPIDILLTVLSVGLPPGAKATLIRTYMNRSSRITCQMHQSKSLSVSDNKHFNVKITAVWAEAVCAWTQRRGEAPGATRKRLVTVGRTRCNRDAIALHPTAAGCNGMQAISSYTANIWCFSRRRSVVCGYI